MGEGIVDGDLLQLFGRAVAKRAAAGGEHDARNLLASARLQRLENRAVLAVDRKDHCAALGGQLRDELSAHHERFLIRQGDGLLGTERGPGAAEAGAADDAGQDDVDFRGGDDLLEPLLADHDFGAIGEVVPGECAGGGFVGRHDPARAKLVGLGGQLGESAMGRECDGVQAAFAGGDDLEGIGPDATGGAQDGDIASGRGIRGSIHHCIVTRIILAGLRRQRFEE